MIVPPEDCGESCPAAEERKAFREYIMGLSPNPDSKLAKLFPREQPEMTPREMETEFIAGMAHMGITPEPVAPEPEAETLPEPTTPELKYLAAITERLGVIIEQNQILVQAFAAGSEPEPEPKKGIRMQDGSWLSIP